MNSKNILKGLIEIYQNDFLCGYEGDGTQELDRIFLQLIVAVTRYTNNYRYCSKPECACSPESEIRRLTSAHGHEIFNVLLAGNYGLSEVPLFYMREFLEGFQEV